MFLTTKINLIITIAIIILFMIAMFAILYNDTKNINIKKFVVQNNIVALKKEEVDGIKIVFFSDLHIGKLNKKEELKELLDYIISFNADIYIFGGDLIGSNIKKHYSIEEITKLFSIFNNKCFLGVYGNHEYKKEKNITTEEKMAYYHAMNCHILKNDYYTYYKDNHSLTIYGMNDYIYNDFKLPSLKSDLIICHEGDIIDKIDNVIMLSGHSHGGQIRLPLIPLFYKPKNGKKYTSGLYKTQNSQIIVSNGLGFNGLKLRFFAKRDIIILKYKK